MDRTIGRQQFKDTIIGILRNHDPENDLKTLKKLPLKKVINALLPFLCQTDPGMRWYAIQLLGQLISLLADDEPEAARVYIRRFIWNLNDESGGIGWGGPEVMAEVFALHGQMAEEFALMLVAFIREDGSFLEYDVLQQGVLWGLGRLAQTRPHLLNNLNAGLYIEPFLTAQDPHVRGLAAWTAGFLHLETARPTIETLLDDPTEIQLFEQNTLRYVSLQQIAHETLQRLADRSA